MHPWTKRTGRAVAAWALTVCALAAAGESVPQAQTDRWAKEMAAFDQADEKGGPAPGGVVFVGSSSIRLWDLPRWFPGLPVTNRGFGGSEIADAVRHADRLVIRHAPRVVIFYAGDNDLANGKTPETVAADYRAFVARVHAALPETRIAFIGIKPSVQRWGLIERVREANRLVRAFAAGNDRLGFVDVDGPMLGWDERPRPELLAADGLHLSDEGYALWTTLVMPFVK